MIARLSRLSPLFVALLAICILIIEKFLLRHWLIDDAAISLAYARNLAEHGQLVSQLGAAPVEGFSNPLWTFMLAITQFISPTMTALTFLPLLCLAWVCWRLTTAFSSNQTEERVAQVALLFLILQPAVAIWGFSGLENPLYLASGVELLIRMSRAAAGTATKTDSLMAGIAASCLALTRPEGVLYAPLFFLSSLYGHGMKGAYVSIFIRSLVPPALALALYTIFRYWYFEALVPNTYLAKGGPSLEHLKYTLLLEPDVIIRAADIYRAIFGDYLKTWGFLLSTGLLVWIWRLRPSGLIVASTFMSLCALFAFVLLPGDWMGEVRFATLFFPGFYLAMSFCLYAVTPRRLYTGLIAFLLLVSLALCFDRLLKFRDAPPISVAEVVERSQHLVRWGRLLDQERPTVLTADVGGSLLMDEIQVIDLGMLTDRTIAETLGEGTRTPDVARFRDYIFDERKPVLIEIRAYHTWIAKFDDDPRFQRDYVAIKGYQDGWVMKRYGKAVTSGDFVRRDLVENRKHALNQMQVEAAQLPYPFSEPDGYVD